MNRARTTFDRVLRSRRATAASVAAGALVLSLAVPSLLSALGSHSGPVGCGSGVDFTDGFTDDVGGGGPVGEGSNPCVLVPDSPSGNGGDDDSGGGGVGPDDVDAGVVVATPSFTG